MIVLGIEAAADDSGLNMRPSFVQSASLGHAELLVICSLLLSSSDGMEPISDASYCNGSDDIMALETGLEVNWVVMMHCCELGRSSTVDSWSWIPQAGAGCYGWANPASRPPKLSFELMNVRPARSAVWVFARGLLTDGRCRPLRKCDADSVVCVTIDADPVVCRTTRVSMPSPLSRSRRLARRV
jgi:hypothetical protein